MNADYYVPGNAPGLLTGWAGPVGMTWPHPYTYRPRPLPRRRDRLVAAALVLPFAVLVIVFCVALYKAGK